MKTIRVWFLDFGSNVPDNFIFYRILKIHYFIELDKVNPDYLFYSDYSYDFLKYDCIRIHYSIEQGSPDFDLSDYEIGYDYLDFGDRYIRYPYYLTRLYNNSQYDLVDRKSFANKISPSAKSDYLNREFCSFISSNPAQKSNRDNLFLELSSYKRVNSAGRHLNNVGYSIEDNITFISKHKFHISAENAIYDGYTTEKIYDAFLSKVVPIYIGNPKIDLEFNPLSFIDANKFNDFEHLIEFIIEIDNDDDKYIKMLTSPKILSSSTVPNESELESFLINIFSQSLEESKRRPNSQRSVFKTRIWIIGTWLIKIYNKVPLLLRRFFLRFFKL